MTATTPDALSAKERLAKRLEEKRREPSSSERGSTASSPSGPVTTITPSSSGTTRTDLGKSSLISKTAPSKQVPVPITDETEIPSSPKVTETARIVVSLMSDNSLVFGGENINKIGVGVIQNIARRLPRHVMEYARKELIRVRTEQRAAERQQQG